MGVPVFSCSLNIARVNTLTISLPACVRVLRPTRVPLPVFFPLPIFILKNKIRYLIKHWTASTRTAAVVCGGSSIPAASAQCVPRTGSGYRVGVGIYQCCGTGFSSVNGRMPMP